MNEDTKIKIIELEKKIDALTKQVNELQRNTQLVFPIDIVSSEIIRNTVIQGEDLETAKTQNISLSGDPQSITVVKALDGLLIIKYKNKSYKIGFYA